MKALPLANALLGVALVVAAVFLLYHGIDGAARAILFAASACAFGTAAPRLSNIRRRKKTPPDA